MPVIDAPALSEDEALRLVYAKAAAHRRRRTRRARRGAALAALLLVAGGLGSFLLVGGGASRHKATYALPAPLPAAEQHQILANLEARFRSLGYRGAQSFLAGEMVNVAWKGQGAPTPSAVAQLGSAGQLSLRPVLGTHEGPCGTEALPPSSSQSYEAPGPAGSGQCLELGPTLMSNLAFSATRAVHDQSGWAVDFVVSSPEVDDFDQVGIDNQGKALAILVDNEVLTDPVVHDPYFGGHGTISGHFDQVRAEALAAALRYRLPLSLAVVKAT